MLDREPERARGAALGGDVLALAARSGVLVLGHEAVDPRPSALGLARGRVGDVREHALAQVRGAGLRADLDDRGAILDGIEGRVTPETADRQDQAREHERESEHEQGTDAHAAC